jgi:hypothetical protein
MKRRSFVQSLVVAPAASTVVAAQQTTPQQQPVPKPNTPAKQEPRQPGPNSVPRLQVVKSDLTAEFDRKFFNDAQFASVVKLAAILVPPIKNNPGAVDAKAPEFLDFLLSVSPSDRQELYKQGLDGLDSKAKEKYQHAFGELDPKQVDALVRPLLVARFWPHDLPSDPMQNFMTQIHEDLRTATMNSREWAEANSKGIHRFTRGARTSGMYWLPIDPIVES